MARIRLIRWTSSRRPAGAISQPTLPSTRPRPTALSRMRLGEWNGKMTFNFLCLDLLLATSHSRHGRQKWIKVNSLLRHDLTLAQRQEYTKAVLCLQSKAPIAPKKQLPGSMNRFDDFVATHESQVSELHSTVSLAQTGSL
jgi:hypothetical protein